MTDTPQWFHAAGEDGKGPYTVAEMRALISGRVISSNSLVWSSALPERLPLHQSPLAAELGRLAVQIEAATPAVPSVSAEGWADLFVLAVRTCFSKYADFSGRAGRAEYWLFVLFCVLVSIVIGIVEGTLSGGESRYLSVFFSLGVFLPHLAVLVRRLHDTGRSGWWAVLELFPLVGTLVLLVFCVQPGTKEQNRFG